MLRTYHNGRFPYFQTKAHLPSLEPDFICALALAGSPGLGKLMKKMVNHAYQEYIAHCLISKDTWRLGVIKTLIFIEFAGIMQSILIHDK